MEKFLTKIKEVLNQANEEYGLELDVAGYLETIRQNKDEFNEVLEVYRKTNYMNYFEDETEGYTNGEIELNLNDKTYTLTLLTEFREGKYCMCKPTDRGYNEEHHCCGNGCDWEAPVIQISKSNTVRVSYQGTARELWNLEETKQNKSDEINELRKALNENLQYINEIATNIYKINEQLNKLQRAM